MAIGLQENGLLYVVSLIYRLNQSKVYMKEILFFCDIISAWKLMLKNPTWHSKCLFGNNEDECYFAEIGKNVRK